MPADVTLCGLGLEVWHDVAETQDAISARLGVCTTLTSAGFTLGTASRSTRSDGGPHSLAYASAPLGTLQPIVARSALPQALSCCLDGKMHVGCRSGTLRICEATGVTGSRRSLQLRGDHTYILGRRRPPKGLRLGKICGIWATVLSSSTCINL